MAKHKVGVLEASASPESTAPETFCGRAIAEYLVNEHFARKIGKRLIHMVKLTAVEAIELAKRAREAAAKLWERHSLRLGIGNILPFSRRTDPNHHFHYEIPHANDRGIRRWGFRARASKRNEKLETRTIKVSARPRQSTFMPATAAPTSAMRLADAFPS
jgi:hypothetical protein